MPWRRRFVKVLTFNGSLDSSKITGKTNDEERWRGIVTILYEREEAYIYIYIYRHPSTRNSNMTEGEGGGRKRGRNTERRKTR